MDLQRAKELLSGLADGVDPLTGEVLPEDHVCNKAEIIRAFHCVLKALPGKPPKPQPENAGKPWNDADDEIIISWEADIEQQKGFGQWKDGIIDVQNWMCIRVAGKDNHVRITFY